MIFVTADTHFNHQNIIRYCNRPYQTVEGMNEAMIIQWNSVVTDGDTVYHLGDFGWNPNIVPQLNGTKYIVPGNHDGTKVLNAFDKVLDPIHIIRHLNKKIVMSHYPMTVWEDSHMGSIHLHGHCHGSLPETQVAVFDVGIDVQPIRPIDYYINEANERKRLMWIKHLEGYREIMLDWQKEVSEPG